jgi:hypothetical protein
MAGPAYTRFDFGGMGEFDIYLLAKQYGVKDPPNYFRHWRGGYYYAAQAKSGPKDQIAMLYFSRWDSPQAARDFANMYADYTPKRYKDKVQWTSTCPAASNGSGAATCSFAASTKQGRILIEQNDSDLLIMEGYDDAVVANARGVLFFGMSPPSSTKDKNSK